MPTETPLRLSFCLTKTPRLIRNDTNCCHAKVFVRVGKTYKRKEGRLVRYSRRRQWMAERDHTQRRDSTAVQTIRRLTWTWLIEHHLGLVASACRCRSGQTVNDGRVKFMLECRQRDQGEVRGQNPLYRTRSDLVKITIFSRSHLILWADLCPFYSFKGPDRLSTRLKMTAALILCIQWAAFGKETHPRLPFSNLLSLLKMTDYVVQQTC